MSVYDMVIIWRSEEGSLLPRGLIIKLRLIDLSKSTFLAWLPHRNQVLHFLKCSLPRILRFLILK